MDGFSDNGAPLGVPYRSVTGPEVPVADHTAAKIIASGDIAASFIHGFAAFANAAAERQHLQLQSEQQITDAALKSRQLDIARENNKWDFDVGMKNAKAYADHQKLWADINKDPNNPAGMMGQMNIRKQKLMTYSDFGKRANELDLLNPDPKNPVQYYANVQKITDEYAFADDMPEIKNALTEFKSRTEKHAVPIREGVKFDDKRKTYVASGDSRQIPVGDIVERLNDPDQRESTLGLLERNGLVTTEKRPAELYVGQDKPSTHGWFDRWTKGLPAEETVRELSPSMQKYMQMGKGVDFSRSKARTPVAGVTEPALPTDGASTMPASADGKQAVTTRDVGDASATLFAETAAEKLKKSYQAHSSDPNFNKEAAKAFMQQQGIDTSDLE